MAGKAKSCYLTVTVKTTHKTVLSKVFFNAKAMNDHIRTPEFQEKYPLTEFNHVKETY